MKLGACIAVLLCAGAAMAQDVVSSVVAGINAFFPTAIYVGALLSVALAVAADALLLAVQRRLTPWSAARGETS